MITTEAAPAAAPEKAPGKAPEKAPAPAKAKEAAISAPARLIVNLPADAKLFIDDEATASTSSVRTFSTPALQGGKAYTYTLRAELNGQSVTKVVTVRAGEETTASLDLPVATTAAK